MKVTVSMAALVVLLMLSGCVSTLQNFHSNVVCPVEYVFPASYEKTWNAAVQSVLEMGTADEINKKDGRIVSGPAVVDGRKARTLDQALFGQVYKFSYDIHLLPEGKSRTRIITHVRLFYEQLAGLKKVPTRSDAVEHYLRDKFYRQICAHLFPNDPQACSRGFASGEIQPRNKTVRRSHRVGRKPDPKVRFTQATLTRCGYQPGPADGLMGHKTRNALKNFQRDNDLEVTGTITSETYELLESDPPDRPQAVAEESIDTVRETSNTPGDDEEMVLDLMDEDTPSGQRPEQELTPSPGPAPKKVTGKFVTTEVADLLKEEDLYGSEILATIPANTRLKVLSKDGEYYKIKYKGKTGYVYGDFVRQQ